MTENGTFECEICGKEEIKDPSDRGGLLAHKLFQGRNIRKECIEEVCPDCRHRVPELIFLWN